MRPLRVAILSLHGCPLMAPGSGEVGGMQAYIWSLSGELASQGVAVDIFSHWHDAEEPELVRVSDQVRVIHLPGAGKGDLDKERLAEHLADYVRLTLRYAGREEVQYDLLHSHYWLSGWVGERVRRAWHVPHVVNFHTLGEIKNRAWQGQRESRRRIATERRLVADADAIIATSAQERIEMMRLYDAEPERVAVIPCGVDLATFRPQDRLEARSLLGLPSDGSFVLYAGRIEPFKGLDLLIQASAMLEDRADLTVLIAGGHPIDPEVRRLQEMAGSLGLEQAIRFLGTIPHDRMPLYYSAADVCVVPSYHETFGLAALEAMACGTPVVATNVGGLQSLIRDGETGYLVAWHCPDPFADRLELLLRNASLREAMGRAARAWAEKFSWSSVAAQVLNVYRQLLPAQP